MLTCGVRVTHHALTKVAGDMNAVTMFEGHTPVQYQHPADQSFSAKEWSGHKTFTLHGSDMQNALARVKGHSPT